MYTWYRPIRQTKMPANLHYAPIHPTYCSSNILHLVCSNSHPSFTIMLLTILNVLKQKYGLQSSFLDSAISVIVDEILLDC